MLEVSGEECLSQEGTRSGEGGAEEITGGPGGGTTPRARGAAPQGVLGEVLVNRCKDGSREIS